MRPDLDLDPDGLDAAAAQAAALGLDLEELAQLLDGSGDDGREIGRVIAGAAEQMVAAAEEFRRVTGTARRAEADAARVLG